MADNIEKSPNWAWWLLGAVSMLFVIVAIVVTIIKKDSGASSQAYQPRAAIVPIQKTIIWEMWKEVELSTEWSEYFDTPTKWDRVVAPPNVRVEVLYENGKYFELKGRSIENRREGIEVKTEGKFKLRGSPNTKAKIWVGRI